MKINPLTLFKKFERYFNNTLWIIGGKLFSLGATFLLTVVVARYLGAKDFGIYSYVTSLISLFAIAGHMGLSGLVVRELVKYPEERGVVLGTTLGLKLFGMILGYVLLLIYGYYYEGPKSLEFSLIMLAGLALIIRSYEIIDMWFQSFVQAKYVSIAEIIGVVASSASKLLFVLLGLSISSFILSNLIQYMVIGIVLIIFYIKKSELSFNEWSFSRIKAKYLLSQGWVIYLGAFFAIINLKIDQVMLKWLQGAEQVGIYSVAAQLSEAWYFIPTAIVASFFPKLIELKDSHPELYQTRLQQLLDLLFFIALIVAVAISLSSGFIIELFFGDEYIESSDILIIHIWGGVFIFMRALFSKWILIEDALIFSLITQAAGALTNVILNYYWIKDFGSIGAAYSTVFSYATSSFLSLAIYKKTRPLFWLMLKSMSFASVFQRILNR